MKAIKHEQYGLLNHRHLQRSKETISKALDCHLRTFALRVDLRLPDELASIDPAVISRFIASLRAKIKSDLKRKEREGKRVHPCTLRFLWVREFNQGEGKKHYHVVLLLNKDTYTFMGDYNKVSDSLASMISHAWTSALNVDSLRYKTLTHFPKNPWYSLNRNKDDFQDVYSKFIYRIEYLAKLRSKCNGDGERNFGCSQY
jgi:hypothetical protein